MESIEWVFDLFMTLMICWAIIHLPVNLILVVLRERRIASQGADRKPQPPTRSIVGGPGEDQSAATLDHTSNR